MARLAALALAVALALFVAACGGDDNGAGGDEGESGVRAALVTDIGGLNDRGLNALATKGLQRA